MIMSQGVPRCVVVCLACVFGLLPGGCLNQDTTSSLVDLTSSTAGSLVQILVQAGLVHAVEQAQNSPDLSAPISEQEH
jgi:hypothetical protein